MEQVVKVMGVEGCVHDGGGCNYDGGEVSEPDGRGSENDGGDGCKGDGGKVMEQYIVMVKKEKVVNVMRDCECVG